MNNIFIKTVVLCCAVIFSFNIKAVNLYWVGGTGNWSDSNHWSTTSGGTAGAVIPTAADNVFFDVNSFTGSGQIVSVDVTSNCFSMDWTGVINSPTFHQNTGLNIYGSLAFVPAMSVTNGGGHAINFKSTTIGNTINTAGISLPLVQLNFDGIGGEWTLLGALYTGYTINCLNGNLITNNQTIACISFNAPGPGTGNISLGSSLIYVNGSVQASTFSISNAYNLNAGSSNIIYQSTFSYNNLSVSAGHTLNIVTANAPYLEIGGSGTINKVIANGISAFTGPVLMKKVEINNTTYINSSCAIDTLYIAAGKTLNFNNGGSVLTINKKLVSGGTCGQPISIIGNYKTISAPATAIIDVNYAKLTNITGTGGANFVANNSIDFGGNTGWTINLPAAQNLYWIGGTGNFDDPAHWSATSGGASNGCIPSRSDNVFFDSNSFPSGGVVTINAVSECKNMDWTGVTNTPVLTGSSALDVYGSLAFNANMSLTFTGAVSFKSTGSGNTIAMKGKSFSNDVIFNGLNADWTLMDAFTITGGKILNLKAGYLVTNDQTVSVGHFESTTTSNRGLYLGNSSLYLSSSVSSNGYNPWYATNSGYTVDAGTSTIYLTGAGNYTFIGDPGAVYNNIQFQNVSSNGNLGQGSQFNKVTFNGTGTISTLNSVITKAVFMKEGAITNNNSFDTLQFSGGYTYTLTNGKTQNLNKLLVPGTCSGLVTIQSSTSGSPATISSSSNITINYVALKDIATLGGGTFTANNSQNLGNNTGWTINAPTALNLYWVGGSGNWNDPAHWSLTQGGAGGACVPTSADNVFFTTGSFTAGSKTVAMNVDGYCKNMNWTGAQFTPVYTGSGSLSVYGSLTFISGMNFLNYVGYVYFKSALNGNTITTAGRVFNNQVYFDGTGGWILQDALTIYPNSLFLQEGNLNTNGKAVTCNSFLSTVTNSRSLTLGSTIFNLNPAALGSGYVWNINSTNFNLNAGTSTIRIDWPGVGNHAVDCGAGLNYYDIIFIDLIADQSISNSTTSSFHNVTFNGNGFIYGGIYNKVVMNKNGYFHMNNTMDSLILNTAGTTHTITSSFTQIINRYLKADGQSGSLITINGGTNSFLSAPSCNVCCSYLNLLNVGATGGASFYAANSTDGGNNTGWNFASCPSNTLMVGPIVGKATPCNNSAGNIYSIPALSGATYSWSVPAGSGITQGQGSASIVVTAGTITGNISVSVTACGTASVVTKLVTPQSNPIISNINVISATCSNNDGSLTATVNGGNSPYRYQWSSGDTLASAINLFSGQYMLQVTDNNGCKVTATGNVNASNGPSITVVSTTPASCNGGSNGAVTVSISGGTSPYEAHWSNGSTALSLTGLVAGPYDLTINDSINCEVVKTINITQPTAITNSFTSNPSACAGATGDATVFASGGTGSYTYLWSTNAASQTTAMASNLASGVYTVTITDGNNCILNALAIVNNVASTLASTISNIVAGDCSLNSPGSLTMNATGGVGTYTYQWSNGSTNATVSGLFPGTYFCVVTDASLCSSVQSATVPSNIGTILQNLCMVTVDTTSANPSNLIIWEKTTTHDIKSFKIYRETSSQNVYQVIATIPYNSLSEYNDAVANPGVHSWRYKITAIDSCDNETAYSLTHKTIHLTQNLGVGATINLAWDYYDGFIYTTYYIWRHDPSTNWVLLDSLSTNYTAYTDFTPPSINSRYMIEVRPPSACNSSAFKGAGINEVQAQVVKSKSNIRNNFTINIPTGLYNTQFMSSYVKVYPNPAANLLHVDLLLKNGNATIYIVNILGQSVYNTITSLPTNIIDISSLQRGIYTVKVITEKGQAVQKIVVE